MALKIGANKHVDLRKKDKILILDFGSQVSQLIARRIREAGVYCELKPFDIPLEDVKRAAPKGIILSGGPKSVTDKEYLVGKEIFSLGAPILGICYGMQLMAYLLGGTVEKGNQGEFGYARMGIVRENALLGDLRDLVDDGAPMLEVWMSHGDKVSLLPPGFECVGASEACPIAAMANEKMKLYGVQFHPEVRHTKKGAEILKRFAHEVCGCETSWTMPNFIEDETRRIREAVGDEEVILGLSGGVDSSVAAALIHKAIGDKLTCVFVDNGLLRLNESALVMRSVRDNLGVNVTRVDASDRFMRSLAGVVDPEQKRKIIGKEFVEVFRAEAAKIDNAKWLAQGTIYPDVIESAGAKTKKAHSIKSHHNVGGLPKDLDLKLLEPLRDLFKDEVRELGLRLGLPREMVFRHPFPGPGLGVRIVGEVTRERADALRKADDIFIQELRAFKDEDGKSWYEKTSQAFAVYVPQKTVGVMGDGRSYEDLIALRCVDTTDFMTASWSELPYALLGRASNRIINEVKGVNRVVYDVSTKPPATIEWE